jgi:hypothetical protein
MCAAAFVEARPPLQEALRDNQPPDCPKGCRRWAARSLDLARDDRTEFCIEKVIVNNLIALAGIPWDENSSFLRGSNEAPPLIRAALFSEASGLRSESGVEFTPDILSTPGISRSEPGRKRVRRSSDSLVRSLTGICGHCR